MYVWFRLCYCWYSCVAFIKTFMKDTGYLLFDIRASIFEARGHTGSSTACVLNRYDRLMTRQQLKYSDYLHAWHEAHSIGLECEDGHRKKRYLKTLEELWFFVSTIFNEGACGHFNRGCTVIITFSYGKFLYYMLYWVPSVTHHDLWFVAVVVIIQTDTSHMQYVLHNINRCSVTPTQN